jgi:hypothetical protein
MLFNLGGVDCPQVGEMGVLTVAMKVCLVTDWLGVKIGGLKVGWGVVVVQGSAEGAEGQEFFDVCGGGSMAE